MRAILLVAVFSIFAIVPLLHPGEFYDSHEKLAPLFRLAELDKCIREGVFPVRWIPDTYGGRGSPFFNFYAPFFYYLAEVFHISGFSYLWSVKITIALSIALAGVFMYLFAREVTTDEAAFFSSIMYMYAPYLLFDIYVRGSLGEALALAFLPLILFSLHRRSTLLGGVAYAMLIMSHNAIALLFTPFLILYMFYLIFRREFTYKEGLGGLFLGLGLSAFFWIPALAEIGHVWMEWILIYDYRAGFIGLTQLASPSHFIAKNNAPLQLGVLHLVLALIAYPLTRTSYSKFVSALFLLSVFSMSPYSSFLWVVLPFGNYVQFPWRLLTVASLFSSLLGGIALNKLLGNAGKRWAVVISLLIVFSSINFIGYSTRIEVNGRTVSPAELRGYYDSGLTYGHEYLPREAAVPDSTISSKVEVASGNVRLMEIEERCISLSFKASRSGKVKINTFWFPGWKAYIDGLETRVSKGHEGVILLEIPQGLHDVVVVFKDTSIRKLSNSLSLLSLALLLTLLYRKWRKRVEGKVDSSVLDYSTVEG